MNKLAILEYLLKIELQLSESMQEPLTEPESVITWQGIKMISEGCLISILAKSGSRKSRLAGDKFEHNAKFFILNKHNI